MAGTRVECDTIVVCTGIRPNVELAVESGISIGRGIKVNDNMQTSDSRIYAIGECAEHWGKVYGMVAPGHEHAGVAVNHILEGSARYEGFIAAVKLKVLDYPVFSMVPVSRVERERPDFRLRSTEFAQPERGLYRRLFKERGKLVGVISIGDWPELNWVQEAIFRRRRIWPWQEIQFRKNGRIWPEKKSCSRSRLAGFSGGLQLQRGDSRPAWGCHFRGMFIGGRVAKRNGGLDGLRFLSDVVVRCSRDVLCRHRSQ